MKTLAQFKKELGVDSISFVKSVEKDRTFATIKNTTIIVSKTFDSSKPAFVVPTADKDTGEIYPNTFTICNSEKVVMSDLVL